MVATQHGIPFHIGHSLLRTVRRKQFFLNSSGKVFLSSSSLIRENKAGNWKTNPKMPFLDDSITKCDQSCFSIKHDLARSCFQLWPIIGDEDDKIEKINGESIAQTFFSQNFVIFGADYDYDRSRLCFMLYTPIFGDSRGKNDFS